jgi:hypothetical protein
MQFYQILHAIGSSPLFASRAFMPAFVTACLMRFGGSIPWVRDVALLNSVEGVPSWLTHDAALWILGALTIVEFIVEKNSDVKSLLMGLDEKAKPIVALLVQFGVLDQMDVNHAKELIGMDIGSGVLAASCAGGVYVLSGVRRNIYELLSDLDPDDNFRLQRVASWMEDGWVIFGVFLLVLFPLVMLFVSALVIFMVYLFRRFLERKDESKRVDCTGCRSRIYPIAIVCDKCQQKVEQPCAIGFFGQMKPTVAADAAVHSLQLVANGRCSACASRLAPDCLCRACGLRAFDDKNVIDAYVWYVDQRRKTVIPICFALSLVPIIGAVPAIVYYHLSIVAPYRRHISNVGRIKTRWFVRIINFSLVAFQWVPLLGGLSIPLMALTSHRIHRSAFRSRFRSDGKSVAAMKPVS